MPDSINAIDAAYPPGQLSHKTIDQLRDEIDANYRQAGALASMMVIALARGGDRLIEVKKRVGHGHFGDWCADNLKFSKSKAEKMMRLSKKIHNPESIFFNTDLFQNIGISRVWALLDAPEDVAEEVMNRRPVTCLTVRDLKKELARTKNERKIKK